MRFFIFIIFNFINSDKTIKFYDLSKQTYVYFTIPNYLSYYDCLVMQRKLIESIDRYKLPHSLFSERERLTLDWYKLRIADVLQGYKPFSQGKILPSIKRNEVEQKYKKYIFIIDLESNQYKDLSRPFESAIQQYQYMTPSQASLERKALIFKNCFRSFLAKNIKDLSIFGDFEGMLEKDKNEFYEAIKK